MTISSISKDLSRNQKKKGTIKKEGTVGKNQSTSKTVSDKTTEIENIIKDKNEEISQVPSSSFLTRIEKITRKSQGPLLFLIK